MLNPKKTAYRICNVCSMPVPIADGRCMNCGHSFIQAYPAGSEADHIFRGEVFYDGRWMPIEEKAALEKQLEENLLAGRTEYQGQWVPIEEKRKIVKNNPQETKKTVSFPATQAVITEPEEKDPIEIEEEFNVQWSGTKNRRRTIVIALALLSMLTVLFAVLGVLYSDQLPFQ